MILGPRTRLSIAAAAVAFLLGVYAAAGYLLAPSLIRNALVARATQAGLELGLGRVTTHPFALAVEGSDVQLSTARGERLVYARRVTVDLSASSLWRRAWILDRAALEEPVLYAVAWPAGRQRTDTSPPALLIRELHITGGIVMWPRMPRLNDVRSTRATCPRPGKSQTGSARPRRSPTAAAQRAKGRPHLRRSQ